MAMVRSAIKVSPVTESVTYATSRAHVLFLMPTAIFTLATEIDILAPACCLQRVANPARASPCKPVHRAEIS